MSTVISKDLIKAFDRTARHQPINDDISDFMDIVDFDEQNKLGGGLHIYQKMERMIKGSAALKRWNATKQRIIDKSKGELPTNTV